MQLSFKCLLNKQYVLWHCEITEAALL